MGTGIAWPFRVSPTGGVVMDTGQSRKRRLIAHAILTAVGSRIDDPTIGIMGSSYVFRSGTPAALKNVFQFLISEALTKHINQVRLDNLQFMMFNIDGVRRWLIDVLYTDLETYQQERMGVEIPNPDRT
jgi:phage baseplate assembly protein W